MALWFEVPGTSTPSYDLNTLNVDEAYLNITSDSPFYLYELSDECVKCPFVHSRHYDTNESFVTRVSTKFPMTWRIYDTYVGNTVEYDDQRHVCETRFRDFSEFGAYEINIAENNCETSIVGSPVNIYYSLLFIVACLLILTLFCLLGSYCKNKWDRKKEARKNENRPAKRSKRISALDTFRGFCLVAMIFVNDGAGSYAILDHATWNGLHFADLLFPWFIWIMGVCIPISVRSQLKKKQSRMSIMGSIVQRSCTLFLLGLMYNTITGTSEIDKIRIFGVLQRLAVAYFIVATLTTFLMINRKKSDHELPKGSCTDVINLIIIWMIMIGLVAVYYYLTFHFKIPGCPAGYLGPGGIHLNGLYKNCTGGFSGYIDRIILTGNHLYQGHPVVDLYGALPIDPEGPFGCLMSIFQAFIGAQAGSTALCYQDFWQRIKRWLVWGLVFGVLGVILCQGRQEGGWIPLNKTLWSLSYVAVTSSMAFFVLSLLHYISDAKKIWSGAPFHYAGMNSILLYMGHGLCYKVFPFHWTCLSMNTHLILTIEALWGTCLWMLVAYCLYKNNFFVSL